ncbi:hypothetical protein GDO81_009267, partial [Engystomops pustulosus]
GCNIQLGSCYHRAKRRFSFSDGIVFSNRPILPREKVWIKILEVERRWHGALRLGFTSKNPNNIDSLPPFACPNLTDKPDFWAIGIPEEMCIEGEEICFWMNGKGQALFKKKEHYKPKVLFSGMPRRTPLWAMVDIYGQTKALQILNTKTKKQFTPCCFPGITEPIISHSRHHGTTEKKDKALQHPPTEEYMEQSIEMDIVAKMPNLRIFAEEGPHCVICEDRKADTLLLPCRHCSFCKHCVLKIRGQNNICPLCRQSIIITQSIREGHLLSNFGS